MAVLVAENFVLGKTIPSSLCRIRTERNVVNSPVPPPLLTLTYYRIPIGGHSSGYVDIPFLSIDLGDVPNNHLGSRPRPFLSFAGII
jgi:hypothetical protein